MDGDDVMMRTTKTKLEPNKTYATRANAREKVTCNVYCLHSPSVKGNRQFLEAKSCNNKKNNQAVRPSWTVSTRIQEQTMRKVSSTTSIPFCDQDVHFLDLSPKMGCGFVVVIADWDEFSQSLHLTLDRCVFLVRTASA